MKKIIFHFINLTIFISVISLVYYLSNAYSAKYFFIPDYIRKDLFENEIINKISNQHDKDYLLSKYKFDEIEQKYIVKETIPIRELHQFEGVLVNNDIYYRINPDYKYLLEVPKSFKNKELDRYILSKIPDQTEIQYILSKYPKDESGTYHLTNCNQSCENQIKDIIFKSGYFADAINRGIENNVKLFLKGYFGHFFDFVYSGIANWLIIPLAAYFFITEKRRFQKEYVVIVFIYLSYFSFILLNFYFNPRYQFTFMPITLFLGILLLDYYLKKNQIKYEILYFLTIILFMSLNIFLLFFGMDRAIRILRYYEKSVIYQVSKITHFGKLNKPIYINLPNNGGGINIERVFQYFKDQIYIVSDQAYIDDQGNSFFTRFTAGLIRKFIIDRNRDIQVYLNRRQEQEASQSAILQEQILDQQAKKDREYINEKANLIYFIENNINKNQCIFVNNLSFLDYELYYMKSYLYWAGSDTFYTQKGPQYLFYGRSNEEVSDFLKNKLICPYILTYKAYNEYNRVFSEYLLKYTKLIYDNRFYSLYMVN